jgi:hypothetical protein
LNYSVLFARAWRLIWETRFLLLFGLLSGIGSSAGSMLRILVGAGMSRRLIESGRFLSQPELLITPLDSWLSKANDWLLWGISVLFFMMIIVWLVATAAEAAHIRTVLDLESGGPATLSQALVAARVFLGRFIGIDTLIFLPLFLLTLILLIVAFAILAGIVAFSFSGATAGTALSLLAIGVVCLIPLLCLAVPASLFTLVFRTLSFRESVMSNSGVRSSIRRTFRTVRAHLGRIFVLVALTWGLRYVVDLVMSLGLVPLFGLISSSSLLAADPGAISAVADDLISSLIIIGAFLLTLGVHAIANAFTATVWTLSYADLVSAD